MRSCLIVGSGIGGLGLGALLARAGFSVTILEAHSELIGGCAHTFGGKGYKFSAGPRYLWNFGEREIGDRFLKYCGIRDQVPIVQLDRAGFDRVYLGADDQPICVPNDCTAWKESLKERFPQDASGLEQFFKLCIKAFDFLEFADLHGLYFKSWAEIVCRYLLTFRFNPIKAGSLLLRHNYTLQHVFDFCKLSRAAQATLYAHGLIFAEPQEAVSFYAYVGATMFCLRGCYHPAKGMENLVEALVYVIQTNKGRIITGVPVVKVRTSASHVLDIIGQNGEHYTGDTVVANIDPRTFLSMTDLPAQAIHRSLPHYTYSRSLTSLFFGVRDATILQGKFGAWNIWHVAGDEPLPSLYESDPVLPPQRMYLNSPTLVMNSGTDSPAGAATVTAFVPGNYEAFKRSSDISPEAYGSLVERHTHAIIDSIESRFIPGLRDSLDYLHVRTPYDFKQVLRSPQGAVYGKSCRPHDVFTRLPWRSCLDNLYFVGQYTAQAGVVLAIQSACNLYRHLTANAV